MPRPRGANPLRVVRVRSCLWLGLWLGLALAAWPGAAGAQVLEVEVGAGDTEDAGWQSPAPASEGQVVFMLPEVTPEVAQALQQAVEAQLASLDLSARFELPGEGADATLGPRLARALDTQSGEPALAIFLLDAPASGSWLLYLVSADGARVMIRRMAADPERTNVVIEAVAVIVRDYVSALRTGYRIGLAPADTPETPAEAAAMEQASPTEEPPPAGPRLGLTVAYRGSLLDSKLPWQHGAQLGLDLALSQSLRVALAYHLFLPTELDDPAVRLEVWRHQFEPGIALRLFPEQPLGITAQISIVGELFVRSSAAPGSGFVAAQSSKRLLLGPGLRLQGELALAQSADLVLGADVALLSQGVEVYVEEPSRRLLLSAEPLRWGVSAGVLVRP